MTNTPMNEDDRETLDGLADIEAGRALNEQEGREFFQSLGKDIETRRANGDTLDADDEATLLGIEDVIAGRTYTQEEFNAFTQKVIDDLKTKQS